MIEMVYAGTFEAYCIVLFHCLYVFSFYYKLIGSFFDRLVYLLRAVIIFYDELFDFTNDFWAIFWVCECDSAISN